MSLPINIKDLIRGHTVEWERLEFKRGWNPEDVVHTMCAFANDIHNWGGGYIVIGINEKDGLPVLPPAGLSANALDKIQNEILQLGNRIQPAYFPIMQPYTVDGKHILILWCPAGDNRPYSAPKTFGEKSQRHYYIRVGSSSIAAKDEAQRQMYELAARVPFDDRINRQATIDDFDLALIQQYLHEIKSDLYEESKHIGFAELARRMYIAKGSDEDLLPVNVGLMFFTNTPEKFFPRTWIEIVWHKDDIGDNFTEHYFKGALHKQLREALGFIKTNLINEQVRKIPNQAEALRFYNYPFEAIEEVLSNAVYHKGYDLGKPIEVQIYPDRITILSYPGAMPPVNLQIQRNQRIVARDYRNRRIGDFLKELDLTEGRNTGFSKMRRVLASNGSPEALVEIDEENVSFLTTLFINPEYVEEEKKENQAEAVDENGIKNGIKSGIKNGIKSGTKNGTKSGNKGLLSLIQENQNITITELKTRLNVSSRTVARMIENLKKERKLDREGGKNGGKWIILETIKSSTKSKKTNGKQSNR